VSMSPEEKEEAQLPPEAQGEVNGGPLGCCLGTTIGLLLSISIALLSRFYADPLAHLLGGALSIVTRILMVLVAIVGMFICGYFGWRIGKSVYREYASPIIPESGKPKSS
jgi:MFS family permease